MGGVHGLPLAAATRRPAACGVPPSPVRVADAHLGSFYVRLSDGEAPGARRGAARPGNEATGQQQRAGAQSRNTHNPVEFCRAILTPEKSRPGGILPLRRHLTLGPPPAQSLRPHDGLRGSKRHRRHGNGPPAPATATAASDRRLRPRCRPRRPARAGLGACHTASSTEEPCYSMFRVGERNSGRCGRWEGAEVGKMRHDVERAHETRRAGKLCSCIQRGTASVRSAGVRGGSGLVAAPAEPVQSCACVGKGHCFSAGAWGCSGLVAAQRRLPRGSARAWGHASSRLPGGGRVAARCGGGLGAGLLAAQLARQQQPGFGGRQEAGVN